jgi:hypothetical protein
MKIRVQLSVRPRAAEGKRVKYNSPVRVLRKAQGAKTHSVQPVVEKHVEVRRIERERRELFFCGLMTQKTPVWMPVEKRSFANRKIRDVQWRMIHFPVQIHPPIFKVIILIQLFVTYLNFIFSKTQILNHFL